MVSESITCFTPSVLEAIVSAARRAESSGTAPVRVTMPSLLATLTEADFRAGSENIFALIAVVMVLSVGLLHATAKMTKKIKKMKMRIDGKDLRRTMDPPNIWDAERCE